MTQLRNGQYTTDARLDRVREVDLRCLDYLVADVLGDSSVGNARYPRRTARPARTKIWDLTTNLDQGQEGACVGFGWSHELLAEPGRVTGVDNTFARERVYWAAQRGDDWPGGSYPGADPVYEGTSVLAGAKIVRGLKLISQYRWATTIEEIALSLSRLGPMVIGVDWYEGMFDTDDDGWIRPTGEISGGHCVCLAGVVMSEDRSPVTSYVVVHNSWGPQWGIEIEGVLGRARLALIDLAKLLPGGDFCIPLGRVNADVSK